MDIVFAIWLAPEKMHKTGVRISPAAVLAFLNSV
jgi:hypothetical protein